MISSQLYGCFLPSVVMHVSKKTMHRFWYLAWWAALSSAYIMASLPNLTCNDEIIILLHVFLGSLKGFIFLPPSQPPFFSLVMLETLASE
jgi:hypothetical protein